MYFAKQSELESKVLLPTEVVICALIHLFPCTVGRVHIDVSCSTRAEVERHS